MMDNVAGAIVIGLSCLAIGFSLGDGKADSDWIRDCTKIQSHVVGDKVFTCAEVKK